ncbi:MAG TPA: beta-ketoacyl-ACP reductase [Spirochaeta sp.]|nr:beta-ketoacyl-ACP reductase [Spirochaeta sp.]
MKMKNKICLVTGAGRGIGRTITEHFIAEGAVVYAGDLASPEERENEQTHENIRVIQMNVTDKTSIQTAVKTVINEAGRIDVLINNAGITRDGLIQKISDEDWDAVVAINQTGVFQVTREVAPIMMEQGNGNIISLSSVVGIDGNIGQTNYAATKGAVVTMTKTWAKELPRKGAKIRANAIAPGFIRTPMTDKVPQKVLDLMESNTALGRLGEAEDIAKCAVFLASDESSFITGQVIRVDGGLKL